MKYLETLKNIAKDNKKKRENLIFILVLLVILLVSSNYIFTEDKDIKETEVENKIEEQIKGVTLEEKIKEILSSISGISEVSIVINYANDGNTEVVYETKETRNEQGSVTSVEKTVAYNEKSGQKEAIVEMFSTPKVEGVIVVAKGVEGADIKQRISTALANLLGIASYKIQVFEK